METRWPIPHAEFEKLKLFSRLLYDWLPDSKYKIMIRKHNNAVGAIIEDTNFVEGKFDSQYGEKIPWMKGYLPSNNGRSILDEYEEPRKRKVPSTGELHDTILSENDMFILCARNSQSLDDENDDNFTWEISENETRQVMQMRDLDSVQKIAISDLTDKVNEYRLISTNLRTQAETFGRETKKLQEKVNYLQTKNLDLEDQVTELYRQNKILATNKLRDESKLHMEEINAEDLGTAQGMDKMQLAKEAINEFKGVKKSVDAIEKKDDTQALYNELKQTKKELADFKAEVKEEKKKEMPSKKDKEEIKH